MKVTQIKPYDEVWYNKDSRNIFQKVKDLFKTGKWSLQRSKYSCYRVEFMFEDPKESDKIFPVCGHLRTQDLELGKRFVTAFENNKISLVITLPEEVKPSHTSTKVPYPIDLVKVAS